MRRTRATECVMVVVAMIWAVREVFGAGQGGEAWEGGGDRGETRLEFARFAANREVSLHTPRHGSTADHRAAKLCTARHSDAYQYMQLQ